jgi:hypothetical protein
MSGGKHDDMGYMKKCHLTLSGVKISLQTRERVDEDEVHEEQEEPQEEGLEESPTDILNEKHDEESKEKNWKEKFARKIIDQLGVHIDDFELSIDLPKNEDRRWKESIVISGESIELASLGRMNPMISNTMKLKNKIQKKVFKKEAPLLQKFEVGLISAKVILSDSHGNIKSLPLLSPFHYSASIKQFHGKRFGSFSTGLDIAGKPGQRTHNAIPMKSKPVDDKSTFDSSKSLSLDEVDETRDTAESSMHESAKQISDEEERVPAVVLDTDKEEIEMSLGYLQSLSSDCKSLSFAESWDETSVDQIPSDTLRIYLREKQMRTIFDLMMLIKSDSDNSIHSTNDLDARGLFQRPGGLASFKAQNGNKTNRAMRNLGDITSKCNLDFPCIQVGLPNDSTVVLNHCRVKMKGDCSVSLVDGVGGVVIDNVQTLDPGCNISVDILKREITIRDDIKEGGVRAPIEAALQEIRKISMGVVQIIQMYKNALERNMSTQLTTSPSPPQNRWSVQVKGPISLGL